MSGKWDSSAVSFAGKSQQTYVRQPDTGYGNRHGSAESGDSDGKHATAQDLHRGVDAA